MEDVTTVDVGVAARPRNLHSSLMRPGRVRSAPPVLDTDDNIPRWFLACAYIISKAISVVTLVTALKT
jgi:hypothetical protein